MIPLILTLFTSLVFAEGPSIRAQWVCPTENRGELPERREIEVSYTNGGEIRFRPNIFATRPFGFMTRLFGGRRSATGVGECVAGFMENIEAPLAVLRDGACRVSRDLICQKTDEQIRQDIGQKIRGTKFYRKNREHMLAAEASLGTPQSAPPGPVIAAPPVQTRAAQVPVVSPEVRTVASDRPGDTPRARARALDFLIDNYDVFHEDNFRSFQRNCPQLGATQGGNQQYCDFYYRRYRRVISNAGQLLSPLKGRTLSEAETLNALACLPERNQFSDIEEVLQGLNQPQECQPLEVGSFRRFPQGSTYHSYMVKRTDENTYEATTVVDFKYVSGSMTAAQMLERNNRCFRELAPHLRTPDGKQLRLRVLSPAEADAQLRSFERPPTMSINLHQGRVNGNIVRGDAANYNDEFGCGTIVHETLHHLGLCDEYRENDTTPMCPNWVRSTKVEDTYTCPGGAALQPSMAEAWSCRVVPETNTIMQRHWEAIADTVPLTLSCRCKEGNVGDACRAAAAGTSLEANLARQNLAQPTAMTIFGYDVTKNCAPIPYQEMAPYRNNPDVIRNKVSLIGDASPDEVSYVETNYTYGNNRFYPSTNGYRCRCNGDSACQAGIRNGVASIRNNLRPAVTVCPWSADPVQSETALYFPGARPAQPGDETRAEGDVLHIASNPPRPSRGLIAPNHLSRVAFGNCDSGPAASYNRCQRFFQMNRNSPECSAKSGLDCSDQSFLGVSNQ